MVDKKKLYKNWLWFRELLLLNYKSLIAYKTSFILQVIGMAINNIGFLIVWYLFFQIFNDVNGWKYKEVLALYGFVAINFGLLFSFGKGLRKISHNITYGQLDRYLTIPKNILLNLIYSETDATAIGDLIFGIIMLTIYSFLSALSFQQIIIIPFLQLISAVIFAGYLIVTQSIAFWLPNSEEISESLTEFIVGPSLYPNSAFTGNIRLFFIFFIPTLALGAIPTEIILNFSLQKVLLLLLLAGFWLTTAIFIFYLGLKRYESGNLVGSR